MMKLAVLAALAGSAAAFAPAPVAKQSTALSADFSKELGAQAPLGFFDPQGFLKDADQEQFDRFREVELKHGRISMLAVTGYLTTASGYRFPNFPEDVPAGFGAWPVIDSPRSGTVTGAVTEPSTSFAASSLFSAGAERRMSPSCRSKTT